MSPSRAVYTVLAACALPFVSLLVWWRGLRDRAYWRGWSQRWGCAAPLPGSARSIWLHAVSVGEVQAASELIRQMRVRWPALPLVVTCGTPAGCERARALGGADVLVRYAPYDLPLCVSAALRRLRPALLLIIETELWPNLLAGCARAAVPVLCASARLSGRSLRRLSRFPGLLQPALGRAVAVAAQTAVDAERFAALGVDPRRINICGNLKFDRTPGAALRASGRALRQRYASARPLWVAGSTHTGEDALLIAAQAQLRSAGGNPLLVLAPRHRPRFAAVAALLAASGMSWARRSADELTGEPAVLLLDTLGELEAFYAAADLAFVGGSLVAAGGHSLLEPAALGVPTLTGPHQESAPQIAAQLVAAGATRIVADGAALGAAVRELMTDEAARAAMGTAALAVVAANCGALERILALVSQRLGTDPS